MNRCVLVGVGLALLLTGCGGSDRLSSAEAWETCEQALQRKLDEIGAADLSRDRFSVADEGEAGWSVRGKLDVRGGDEVQPYVFHCQLSPQGSVLRAFAGTA